jgi:hypothetical protein
MQERAQGWNITPLTDHSVAHIVVYASSSALNGMRGKPAADTVVLEVGMEPTRAVSRTPSRRSSPATR